MTRFFLMEILKIKIPIGELHFPEKILNSLKRKKITFLPTKIFSGKCNSPIGIFIFRISMRKNLVI
jgi:hypothetical protein